MNPPVLIVLTGKHKGKRVKLTDTETLVGRDEEARLRIASHEVSRQHCLLVIAREGVIVRDLGSRNSTFINGRPLVDETLLKPGDQLTIGPMSFELAGAESTEKSGKPVGAKTHRPVDPKASDDDIANWLGGDSGVGLSTSDTTIIRGSSRPQPDVPPPPPKPPKKEFGSIAEEAADIIRRHKESLAQGD